MLDEIIRRLVNGEIRNPQTLQHGARLQWLPNAKDLLIMRPNSRPDSKEMSTFRRYIRSAGFIIVEEVDAIDNESGINSYMGFALRLKRAEPKPEPGEMPAQLPLI